MMWKASVHAWCVALLGLFAGTETACAQTYESLWKKVANYREQQRPQSALQVVDGSLLPKALREGNRGQELAATLTACVLRQEVVPDSFFSDMRRLERRKAVAAPVERAVTASVLGQLYRQNRRRSQAYDHALAAHPDSLHEWSVEQYDSAARANYLLSVAEPVVLQQAQARAWVPFVTQGHHAAYFKGDLLNVLGRRAMQGLAQQRDPWIPLYGTESEADKRADVRRVAGTLLAAYRRSGNREAELLLMLDSVELAGQDREVEMPVEELEKGDSGEARALRSPEYAAYERMLRTFGDLPLAAEIYIRMTQLDVSPRRKVEWANEALSRYPRYERVAELTNIVTRLQHPNFGWGEQRVYYPGKTYDWALRGRNLRALTIQIYRMKASFSEETMNRTPDARAYVRQHGVPVKTLNHTFAERPAYEEFGDTLQWTAPEAGLYVAVFTPSAPSGAWKTPVPLCRSLHVSAFRFLYQTWPDGRVRGVVVDDESGRPVQGATVRVCTQGRTRVLYRQTTTDDRGIVTFPLPEKNDGSLSVQVSKGNDTTLPETWIYGGRPGAGGQVAQKQIRAYTDRAIYRPGQEVQVGGLIFSQQDWEARVQAGEDVTATLFDANGKEVASRTLKSDEMGTFSTSFRLPTGGLPGWYRIRLGDTWHSVRVEEYKRPTYQVTFMPFTDPYKAGDTIHVRGEARTFAGVPVRRARITGSWRWTYPFRWRPVAQSPSVALDTVYTDEDGRFEVAVPLQADADELRRGCRLELRAEALSPAGETQPAQYTLPVSTTPLRLQADVPDLQDKDRLRAWNFRLLSPSEAPVSGNVTYALYAWGDTLTPVLSGTHEAGKPWAEEALKTLPSGRYRLRATARVGADTASWSGSTVLFGVADTHVPVDTAVWYYCPSDTFSVRRPATVSVGSSSRDVTLYYTLVAGNEVLEDRTLTFSDSILTFHYPYQETYGDGVTATFAFVKNGEVYQYTQRLLRELPDTRLRWKWTSFRDKLTPGAREEWRLSLQTPDGKPAAAQLMATLYDASLDPLAAHSWQLQLWRGHRIPGVYWSVSTMNRRRVNFMSTYFRPVWKDVPNLSFDAFDEDLLQALAFQSGYRVMHLRGTGLNTVTMKSSPQVMKKQDLMVECAEDCAEAEAAPALAEVKVAGSLKFDTVDGPLNGVIGGLKRPALQPAVPSLRTNFNETAFFYPRLATDGNGEVSIRFTLPESLTTWNFLGVAHTADMLTADIQAKATARKEFMAHLLLPRFVRRGDKAALNVTLDNLTERDLQGKLRLEIFEPETETVVYTAKGDFRLGAGRDTVWQCTGFVPTDEYTLLACRVTAESGDYSDGEQAWLPVLSSDEWVTETVELRIDSTGRTVTDLSHLFDGNSNKISRRTLTVEYTAHPVWNAVQALPVLEDVQTEDVLSLAAAYYAGRLAAHIVRENPRLQTVIELWEKSGKDDRVLWSNLQKNEELKGILLNETPWVKEAEDEADRKVRLITLFDRNAQEARCETLVGKMRALQGADGSFCWFPSMSGSEYLTREVAELLVRLNVLTAKAGTTPEADDMLDKALRYLKAKNRERVADMKKAEAQGGTIGFPGNDALHYLYTVLHAGIGLTEAERRDNQYLLARIEKNIGETDREQRALAAIVLKLAGKETAARRFMQSLRENLSQSAAKGVYFEYPSGSFSSIDRKLAVHVLAMEAVDEVLPSDKTLKAGMRRWLLQQKRVQAWNTPMNSANAVYALLKGNGAALNATGTDKLELAFREGKRGRTQVKAVEPPGEGAGEMAGLGYVKQRFAGGDLTGQPVSLTVDKQSAGESWGAVYAQYLAPLSEVKAQTTGLRIRRELSTKQPKVGDKLVQRYVITADRDYEYVMLKAGGAACLEPGAALSGYAYSDGLGYYRVVRDASTEYYFDRLPKGTYVLEHTAHVDRTGTYSAGLVTLKCLYAPEYSSHTGEVKIHVEP